MKSKIKLSKKLISNILKIILSSFVLYSCSTENKSDDVPFCVLSNLQPDNDLLYYDTDNEVRILFNGVKHECVSLFSNNCTINKTNNSFIIKPSQVYAVTLYVEFCNSNKVDSLLFPVSYLPLDFVCIYGINANEFCGDYKDSKYGEICVSSSIDRNKEYKVIQYSYLLKTNDGRIIEGTEYGCNIADVEKIAKELKPGASITLNKIKINSDEVLWKWGEAKFLIK